MKITYMLRREDFYEINRNTLKRFYNGSTEEKRLYIYPELNAIVTARPSKKVRQYLYTEFRVNGSALKRLLVRLYATILLNSGGLLASSSLKIRTDADRDTLIYPCNKKYRVFDFRNNRVSVVAKDGFPQDGLRNEIAFRMCSTAEFVPGLLDSDENGYSEVIIDGYPVARAGERMTKLSDCAFGIWTAYIAPYTQTIQAREYAVILRSKIDQLKLRILDLGKRVNIRRLDALCDGLLATMNSDPGLIPVSLSHGDLQPGNIWVENATDKLYIIDWETFERRSIWYDKATLYENLRRSDGICRYANCRDLIHVTVLLEDVVFRLAELTELPYDYGCADFDAYLSALQRGSGDV